MFVINSYLFLIGNMITFTIVTIIHLIFSYNILKYIIVLNEEKIKYIFSVLCMIICLVVLIHIMLIVSYIIYVIIYPLQELDNIGIITLCVHIIIYIFITYQLTSFLHIYSVLGYITITDICCRI